MASRLGTSYNQYVPRDIRENLRWRARVHREVREDPDYADVIWSACAADPVFYLSGFCYTYNPRRKSGSLRNPFSKLPFILYPFQEEAILDLVNSILNGNDLLIEKSREMGASWVCLSAFEWAWHFCDDRLSFLLGSRNERYVDDPGNPKSLFWKIDYLLDTQPRWLLPRGYEKSRHRSKLHFTNPESGSAIDGESTTDEFARGDRRTAILLDEFAAVKQGHRILSATRDATDCRVFNSTPKGCGNAYYDIAQLDIMRLRMHWSIHPYKNSGLYTTDENGDLKIMIADGYPEGYIPILDGKLRSPWYDSECKRASTAAEIAQELDIDYLGSGHQYFNPAVLQELGRLTGKKPMHAGFLDYVAATGEPVEWVEKTGGRMEWWVNPESIESFDKFVLAADISAGTGASNSVAVAYNARTNEKVFQYVNPRIRPEEFAKQLVAVAKFLNNAFLVWENNGVGRQFGARVIDLRYGNVYYDRNESVVSKKQTEVPGWASTKEKKLVLLGEYRDAMEAKLIINRSTEALDECLHYVYADDGGVEHDNSRIDDPSGAKSNHGDRVIADALAWRGLSARPAVVKTEEREPPYGSLAWRIKQREIEKARQGGRELLRKDGWGP